MFSFWIIRHFSVTAGPLSSASSRTAALSQGDVTGVKASHMVVKRRAELYAEMIGPEMLVRERHAMFAEAVRLEFDLLSVQMFS